MAKIPLESLKDVRDRGGLSYWVFIIAPGQKA